MHCITDNWHILREFNNSPLALDAPIATCFKPKDFGVDLLVVVYKGA